MNIKPLPSDIVDTAQDRDEAEGGWNLTALEAMLSNCDSQPNYWRDQADYAAGYIDGKQFTAEQEIALRAEGMKDARPTNLVGKVVRSMCGEEAKARTDVKVEADDEDEMDVVEVLNQDMKESRRECKIDMAVSGAYAGQVGLGIGWLKIDTDPDPLNYPDRAQVIDRRCVWWDWEAKHPLLKDARWLVYKDWVDLDELVAAMPRHRRVLENAANGWQNFSFDTTDYDIVQVNAFEDFQRFGRYRTRTEWWDSARRMVKIYEVWYRVPAMAVVLHLSGTRRVVFDDKNQSHINAVVSGQYEITKSLTSQVRMSLYAGPHRLQDIGTTRRVFPFVPFFAYRDDQDKTPYGIVEGMIGPQDEYNARRIRINWLLRARQVQMDSDALDTNVNTLAQVVRTMMRPDQVVITNPNRINRNSDAVKIGNALSLEREQIDVMQDAKQLIQDVPGRYGSQLGQASSGVTSGIANSLLIEQGSISMGDLNDNYRDSRQLAHEILLDQIIARRNKAGMRVKIGRGSSRRVVVLNTQDEQTGEMVNCVADAAARVALGEVPNTAGYRMQQQQQIATIIGALQGNPQAVAVLTPVFIESTDLPNRMQVADDLRRASGIPTSDDKQAQQQQQELQQQKLAEQEQLQKQALAIEMAGKAAEVEETQSKTHLNQAKAAEIGHEMGMAEVAATQADKQMLAQAAGQQPSAEDMQAQEIEAALAEAMA